MFYNENLFEQYHNLAVSFGCIEGGRCSNDAFVPSLTNIWLAQVGKKLVPKRKFIWIGAKNIPQRRLKCAYTRWTFISNHLCGVGYWCNWYVMVHNSLYINLPVPQIKVIWLHAILLNDDSVVTISSKAYNYDDTSAVEKAHPGCGW